MDYLELQNAVLSDRFDESKRADIKRSLNARYGRVWSQEPWPFKIAPVTINLAQGDSSALMGTLQTVHSLWDNVPSSSYGRMTPDRPEDFYDWARTTGARQRSFTVMGSTIYFDSPAYAAATMTAVGELKFVSLVADADEPLIPEEFHMMLVHGATSEELRRENDPTWQGAEQDYAAYLEDMKKSYLTSVRNYGDAAPSWPSFGGLVW